MRSILLLGVDEDLLRTRAAVLARTGWQTNYALPTDALEVQAWKQAELVVLCHSVPVTVADALTHIIRERWPATRVILVQKQSEANLETGIQGVDAVSPSDPERLLTCVAELMGVRSESFAGKTAAYSN